MSRVLIVEDEVELCRMLADQIRNIGLDVDAVFNAEDGIKNYQESDYWLVLTDIRLPGMDGVQMMGKMKIEKPDKQTTFFVMSGFSDYSLNEIKDKGAHDFFEKPGDLSRLVGSIKSLPMFPLA